MFIYYVSVMYVYMYMIATMVNAQVFLNTIENTEDGITNFLGWWERELLS